MPSWQTVLTNIISYIKTKKKEVKEIDQGEAKRRHELLRSKFQTELRSPTRTLGLLGMMLLSATNTPVITLNHQMKVKLCSDTLKEGKESWYEESQNLAYTSPTLCIVPRRTKQDTWTWTHSILSLYPHWGWVQFLSRFTCKYSSKRIHCPFFTSLLGQYCQVK